MGCLSPEPSNINHSIKALVKLHEILLEIFDSSPLASKSKSLKVIFFKSLEHFWNNFKRLEEEIRSLLRQAVHHQVVLQEYDLVKEFFYFLSLIFRGTSAGISHVQYGLPHNEITQNSVSETCLTFENLTPHSNSVDLSCFILLNNILWMWLSSSSASFFGKTPKCQSESRVSDTRYYYTPLCRKGLKTRVPVSHKLVHLQNFFNGKRVFLYGNHRSATNIREQLKMSKLHANKKTELNQHPHHILDSRLQKLLKFNLFQDKTVLDVGCHDGFISFCVAGCLKATSVTGVDIDVQLIECCLEQTRALKYHLYFKHHSKETCEWISRCHESTSTIPHTKLARIPFQPLTSREAQCMLENRSSPRFPFNITFLAEDFTHTSLDYTTFDTILALAVTKWLHIHSGDAGLKSSFHTMAKLLKPGGCLVLEPQSWEAYKGRNNGPAKHKISHRQLYFKPHHFDRYIQESVGLKRIGIVRTQTTHKICTIFIYQKA